MAFRQFTVSIEIDDSDDPETDAHVIGYAMTEGMMFVAEKLEHELDDGNSGWSITTTEATDDDPHKSVPSMTYEFDPKES
jgi:hypothetical protein